MRSLAEFTADILDRKGAVVELTADGIDAVLPPDVASALELPEYARLSFDAGGANGAAVSYEGDVFKNMSRLVGSCRFAAAVYPPSGVQSEKINDILSKGLVFNNAVFRIERMEEKPVSYLLACFKYTTVSDEKQEGIVTLLINELNMFVRRVDGAGVLSSAFEGVFDGWSFSEGLLHVLAAAPAGFVREENIDFAKSLERRLNRDIRRVQDYYGTLTEEARLAVRKAAREEDRARAENKIRAIDIELKWKIQDMVSKHRLDIAVEPVSFVRVETTAAVFWVEVRRRKGSRLIPVAFNPMLKDIDRPSCASCFNMKQAYLVCDDELHIVCDRCLSACDKCGRTYCRACHKGACPHCRRA